MKKITLICLLAGALAVGAAYSQADPNALVSALSGGDAGVRHEAYENAAQYGPAAIGPVAALLDHEDVSVVRAAKTALEKIVGAATEEEACAQASGALCAAALTVQDREWLLWLLSYAGTKDALPALCEMLGRQPAAHDQILLAIQAIATEEVLDGNEADRLQEKLVKVMLAVQGRKREGVINVLGAIGNPTAVDILLEEMECGEGTQDRAIEALGRIGDERAADALFDAYADSGKAAVLDAYLRIAEALPKEEAAKRYMELLELDLSEAQPMNAAGLSGHAAAKCAALRGLGKSATKKKAVKKMLPYLEESRADIAGAAKAALIDIEGEKQTQFLVRVARKAQPEMKTALLEILVERDAELARKVLDRALEDESAEVRVAALRLLGDEVDLSYEDTFLEAAQQGSDAARPAALEGYLRLAAKVLAQGDRAKALAMHHTALDIAERDEERVRALEGLTEIADPSTLDRLATMRTMASLHGPMGNCALAIAAKLHEEDPETAAAVYDAVLEQTRDRRQANTAAQGLIALGAEADFARKAGFVTQWQLIGPFPNEGFAKAFPPEVEYKADAVYPGAAGQELRWTPLHVTDVMGVTELDAFLNPKERVIAYARAEVTVEKTQDILLKMGSDDGIAAWVNGELVHVNDASRGLAVDSDTKPATLVAGTNVILVKIVQGGGDWSFCVRLTGRNGLPLDFVN